MISILRPNNSYKKGMVIFLENPDGKDWEMLNEELKKL
jgi:hypothetical protein